MDESPQSTNGRKPAILLIAGEGGHLEQARRVASRIEPKIKEETCCILLTDHVRESDRAFQDVVSVPTCAPKHRAANLSDFYSYLVAVVKVFFRLRRQYKMKAVIVTGPGFALFPALAYRLTGSKLVVFESWSRFEDKSKCSRALYPFAHHFLVQHKELLKIYPRAVWVGLL